MPSTSFTTENELLTSTLRDFIQAEKSMQDRPTRFLDDLDKMGKRMSEGGESIQIDWETNRHSQPTRLTTGYEIINLTAQKVGTPGRDDWGEVVYPVVMSQSEDWRNRGKAKRLDILERRARVTFHGAREDLQKHFLQGGVSGFDDILSYNGFDNTDGMLEQDAVGSQTNTLHTLSRAAFATLPGFQNQVFDIAGSFSANGLDGLTDVSSRIKELAGEGGIKLMGYGSIEFMNNLKKASRTFEQFIDVEKYDGGKMVQVWDGIRLQSLADQLGLPNAGSVTTADPISCIIVDFASIYCDAQTGYWFDTGDFREATNQLVRWSPLHIVTQLLAEYLGSSGVLFDGNVF